MRTRTLLMVAALTAACVNSDETTDDAAAGDTLSAVVDGSADPDEAGRSEGTSTDQDDRTTAPPSAAEGGASTGGAPPSDDARDDATIPAAFRGEWNSNPAACGTPSEGRLRITADEVRFYESAGEVQSVEIVNDRTIVVTGEYQGEGQTWQDERRFTLSADGSSLTVDGNADFVRQRCG